MSEAVLVCADCGKETERRGPGQRYCEACSTKRDLLRKRLWAREHPPSPHQQVRNVEHHRQRGELAREAGAIANQEAKQSVIWYGDSPDLLWLVRVAVPFSYAVSKNHLYTLRSTGHIALRREARAKRKEIALTVRQALGVRRVAHNKLWIDLLVQKPDHKGDAVNVVDVVCDALQEATGLNDRWFCIRRLDWEIVRSAPRLYIGIGQDSERDCQVCCYCGRIKDLNEFGKHKHGHMGFGRECKECRRIGRILRKQRTLPPKEAHPESEA